MFFFVVCFGMAIFMAFLYVFSMLALAELVWKTLTLAFYSYHPLKLYLIFEAIFILVSEFRFRIYHKSNHHLPKLDDERFEALCTEFQPSAYFDPTAFVKGWFNSNGEATVPAKKEDLDDWVNSMMWNKKSTDPLTPAEQVMQTKIVGLVQDRLLLPNRGIGENKAAVKKLLLTTDTPFLLVRPFLFYAGVRVMYNVGLLALRFYGFTRMPTDHKGVLSFFKKSTTTSRSGKPAIVIFHGLGIGLSLYIPFLDSIHQKFPDHDIVLFEKQAIIMALDTNYILPSRFADQVAQTLAKLGIEKAVFIGHSLGSSCVRWMDHFHPELVHSRIYVDPICFQLWNHDVAFNAVYRWPSTAHEAIIKFIAMAEPGIGTYLHRNFVWFQNTYFSAELPKNCRIYLSSLDDIVNVNDLTKYLSAHPDPSRKVFMMDKLRHGEAFFLNHWIEDIGREIKSLLVE